MIFAALVAVPFSAMMCVNSLLYFFILFPVAALAGGKRGYLRRLVLMCFPSVVMLIWFYFSGNSQSTVRSLRWICAIASGTYFATVLGSSGIAAVLKSIPFAAGLSDLMLLAGGTAFRAGACWAENSELPLVARVIQSASDSIGKAESVVPEKKPSDFFSLSVAVVSWIFLLVSVSGVADGIAG
jgi:hypothetical protein